MTKPIILIIINHYLPGEKVGGPVRTISNMVEWLGDDFDFRILTSDRDIGDSKAYSKLSYGVWITVGKAQVRYLAPHEQSLSQLRQILCSINCELVYLDGVFASLSVKTLFLRRLGFIALRSVMVVPRGQWRPEALAIKSRKKTFFMWVARVFGLYNDLAWHVSSAFEYQDVKQVTDASEQKLRVIPNLPLAINRTPNDNKREIKTINHLRMVFLSRIVHNKGLDFLLECLLCLEGKITLDIYGTIEEPNYWKECQALIEQLPGNITATYKGVVGFSEVINTLSEYHLFVLPTLSENFGHVILESLVAGCPVLISNRTPWQDLEGVGWVLKLEDKSSWEKVLKDVESLDNQQFERIAQNAREYGKRYQNAQQLADQLKSFFMQEITN